MPERKSIAVSELRVDPENPRLAEVSKGQNEAMKDIARLLGEKLIALADDIVAYGEDLGDLPFVLPLRNNGYLALEGNRRVVALKALESPEIFNDVFTQSQMKRLRDLSKAYHENPILELLCVVVDERQEAAHWVELRHTGPNDGRGRVQWDQQQRENFGVRQGKAASPGKQALDFLENERKLSASTRRDIPVTSFTRLLSNPEFRNVLGLGMTDGQLELRAAKNKITKALLHVAHDLTKTNPDRTKVDDIKTSKQRKAYAAGLPASIKVKPTIAEGDGRPILAGGKLGKQSSTKQGRRRKRPRESLIPRSCVMSIDSDRIDSVAGELSKLKLEKTPNAIAVMLRVFLELSVDFYRDAENMSPPKKNTLLNRISGVITKLEQQKLLKRPQSATIRTTLKPGGVLVPATTEMNAYVHSYAIQPSPADLRAYWDNLEPLFIAIWTP